MPTIKVSAVIDAPIDDVWKIVRDFGEFEQWHPAADDCVIEGGHSGLEIGAIRNLTIGSETFREQLVEASQLNHYHRYTILDAPVPIENAVGKLQFRSVTTEDRTYGEWKETFDAPESAEDELVEEITALFGNGLTHLRKLVE